MRLHQRQKLNGEQLDFVFPRRGRPTRIRVLERSGQLRLNLQSKAAKAAAKPSSLVIAKLEPETLEAALDLCFPERELEEAEKMRELNRLFQSNAITPENPITDADVPF